MAKNILTFGDNQLQMMRIYCERSNAPGKFKLEFSNAKL